MADGTPEYDWGQVNGQASLRLKSAAAEGVPPGVVAQAQRSWEGVHYHEDGKPQFNEDGSPLMTHNLRYKFPDEATAQKFAVLVKKAGKLTRPATSVQAVLDPDRRKDGPPVDPTVVAWRAGKRPGRTPVV